jgi:RNA polymerase sigma-70 factor, ECF subfamily
MANLIVEQMSFTDLQLVALVRQGDDHAFGVLTQRHWRRCVDLGCYFLRNRSEAEDQAQNAILKAYQHFDQYQGDADFSTWLARIVANECLMLMRSRRRARFVYLDEPPSDLKPVPIQLPSTGPDPEGNLAYSQLNQILQSEVKRIPPLMRDVMLLRHLQELPMKSVAEKLGISVSAAKSRLVRARAELRVRMERYCNGINNPLSRTAAPLSRVGRHCAVQAVQ